MTGADDEKLEMPKEYFFVSDLHIGVGNQLIYTAPPHELSLLQRLVAKKPQRDALEDIPARSFVG